MNTGSSNYSTMKVPAKGGSMMPLIKEGSRLKVNLNPQNPYQTGEIVIFLKNRRLAAHRIIQIKNSCFLLKGDNNPVPDGQFKANQLMGRVEKIIYPGYTIDLTSLKNQVLKYLFVLYSRLNQNFPLLLNLRKFYRLRFLKTFYRFLLKDRSFALFV